MPEARRKRRTKKASPIVVFIVIILAVLGLLYNQFAEQFGLPKLFGEDLKYATTPPPVPEGDEALFHIIDVGQGDAILVMTSEGNMLIDTGESSARDELTAYLDSVNVTSFEYVVFTHPDADHIGNADYIVENYNIKKIIMPDMVATTDTYERMIDAIKNSQVEEVIKAEPEDKFYIGALLNTIIAPNDDYKDRNEMSVVIKSTFGDTSIMLTGDAEVKSEEDIVRKWSKDALKCDVLKVGHHGSDTSTTEEFLDAVAPSIAVISCGEGNKYGHPLPSTLEKFKQRGIDVYRTDIVGSIVLRTNGDKFEVITENDRK